MISNNPAHFNVGEFRVYNVNKAVYPEALSATADKDVPGLVNFVRDAATKISVSGVLKPDDGFKKENLADGKIESKWTTQKE